MHYRFVISLVSLLAAVSTSQGPSAFAQTDERAEATTSSVSYLAASCEDDCCDECDSCCDVCCEKLLGFIRPSAPGFEDFISPMTNPLYFEDPRNLTELRLIFAEHDVPAGVLNGGNVQYLALHIRAALTERLSFIATKDGFLWGQPNVAQDGWSDVNGGLKYTLYSDVCRQEIVSAGLTYEMPVGSTRALQGNGDGDIHAFLSAGKLLGCNVHWITSLGYRMALDDDEGTDMAYWSNHWDYQLTDCWYPFAEVNWYNWTSSGTGALIGIEGGDIYNLGSQGVTGNDIVTGALGIKYKPSDCREIGIVYEEPLTDRRDILESRLTIDYILRY
ncbi:MAG: hypothetical protein DWQ42_09075 [Planctomycetota bacterium]|nr:MAG: hypothetical protein DWQ42_09075 [Planctomycetota bacterium]REK38697.1 MAG: hypothetical protein DWQ46_19900 [Planctomycetota bacterium]